MDVLHPNIESEVLAAILQDKYKDVYVLQYVDPGFFSVDSYKWLVKKLQDRKWERFTWDFVDVILCQEILEPEKRDLYRTQIWNLYQKELTYQKDAEKTFKEFVVISISKSGVKSSFEALDRSKRADYFLKDLRSIISNASIVLEGDKYEVSDWASAAPERMAKRIYYRDNPDLNPVIRTGIKLLDYKLPCTLQRVQIYRFE
jgi:hypothetical protein